MRDYRIKGLVKAETTALPLDGGLEPMQVAFAASSAGAALFAADRLVLKVAPDWWAGWRLTQDGFLRARVHRIVGARWEGQSRWLLGQLLGEPFDGTPGRDRVPTRIDEAMTHQGAYELQWFDETWDVRILGPSRRIVGRFQRLPDGYLVQIEESADQFLILGFALVLLAILHQRARAEAEDREARHVQTVVIGRGPGYVFPIVPVPPRRRRRRHKPPELPKRWKWIDDPVPDEEQRRDPEPGRQQKWIIDPVPDKKQSREPAPEQKQKWINDPVETGDREAN